MLLRAAMHVRLMLIRMLLSTAAAEIVSMNVTHAGLFTYAHLVLCMYVCIYIYTHT